MSQRPLWRKREEQVEGEAVVGFMGEGWVGLLTVVLLNLRLMSWRSLNECIHDGA